MRMNDSFTAEMVLLMNLNSVNLVCSPSWGWTRRREEIQSLVLLLIYIGYNYDEQM